MPTVKSGFAVLRLPGHCIPVSCMLPVSALKAWPPGFIIAGPRGYRQVMLAAGRLGQRLYLGATALGLGCCGIGAFYDREAIELFDMAEQASLLYLLAVGQVKK